MNEDTPRIFAVCETKRTDEVSRWQLLLIFVAGFQEANNTRHVSEANRQGTGYPFSYYSISLRGR